jgi:hypothetical protein
VRVDIPLNLSNGDSSDLSVGARPEEEYAHIERKPTISNLNRRVVVVVRGFGLGWGLGVFLFYKSKRTNQNAGLRNEITLFSVMSWLLISCWQTFIRLGC